MRITAPLMALAMFVSGCSKHGVVESNGNSMEASTLAIRDIDGTSLLTQDDIVSYDVVTHVLTLVPDKRDKITPSQSLIGGSPFTILVDGQSQYSGQFTTSLSSQSIDDVVIDLMAPGLNDDQLQFSLGYPNRNFYTADNDPRNNEAVLSVLHALGKTSE